MSAAPLVAAFLLDHLHQKDLALLDHLLNAVAAAEQRAACLEPAALQVVQLVPAHDLDIAACASVAAAVVAAVGLGSPVVAVIDRGNVLRCTALVIGCWRSLRGICRLALVIAVGPRSPLAGSLVLGSIVGPVLRRFCRRSGRLIRVGGLLLLGIERLPVRDRDLVIVGVDFVEGQEAVAIAAVVDKCRLERGLHAHDLGEIDVSLELLSGSRFEVEFL